jgi:hypothetical protein
LNTTQTVGGEGGAGCHSLEGESFVLSPLYCGSQSLGYARTESWKAAGAVDPNLSLGWAAAISGAAGAPGADARPAGALSALLNLLSARPGAWIEKPKPDGWAAAGPRLGDLPIPASLGLTEGGGEFVYLTTGQEFDRLGVYELIRRRCRFIVAVDAGRDGEAAEAGLLNLIGRSRTDFGIRIEIETQSLRKADAEGLCAAHVAIGQVHYGDVDRFGKPGVFVYVKLSMTGDEPPEMELAGSGAGVVRAGAGLRRIGGDRPFEYYRSAGNRVAEAVFEKAVVQLGKHDADPARKPHIEFVPALFATMAELWGEAPKGTPEPVAPADRDAAERDAAERVRGGGEVVPLAEQGRDHRPEPAPNAAAAGGRGRGRGARSSGTDAGTRRRS